MTVIEDDFLWVERCREQFDAVLFFGSFHHCADHLRLLEGLQRVVAPEGRLFFGAEPILNDFPMPWGIRLDGNSLWALRKNGWLELGFQEEYFAAALAARLAGTRTASRDTGWLTVWEARRRLTVLRFPAADPRIRTHTGQRQGGELVFAAAPAGTAVHGPYVPLGAGRYQARRCSRRGRDSAELPAWTSRPMAGPASWPAARSTPPARRRQAAWPP